MEKHSKEMEKVGGEYGPEKITKPIRIQWRALGLPFPHFFLPRLSPMLPQMLLPRPIFEIFGCLHTPIPQFPILSHFFFLGKNP